MKFRQSPLSVHSPIFPTFERKAESAISVGRRAIHQGLVLEGTHSPVGAPGDGIGGTIHGTLVHGGGAAIGTEVFGQPGRDHQIL
jgi:hypothetical protein